MICDYISESVLFFQMLKILNKYFIHVWPLCDCFLVMHYRKHKVTRASVGLGNKVILYCFRIRDLNVLFSWF